MHSLLLAVGFVSFQPFPRIFDLFDALARALPFLHRSRGCARLYPAAGTSSACSPSGSRPISKRGVGGRPIYGDRGDPAAGALALARAVANAEPGPAWRRHRLRPFPSHFGILDSFVPTSSNMYPVLALHDKAPAPGAPDLRRPAAAGGRGALAPTANGLIGLTNPEILAKLKANGLALVIISGLTPSACSTATATTSGVASATTSRKGCGPACSGR
ncbi:MAG: hypothetical protein MZV64_28935 [Ignavibacteriales bacterium]|nr:hypothetical protein [Ignavibacteriales bacterium]